MYWVTSTFGSDGFDVYRRVFYSALDVLGRDGEACVELVERVAPDAGESPKRSHTVSTLWANCATISGSTIR